SDGEMGGLIDRLQEMHLEACRMARPDPVALAERLFELEMESSFGAFHQAVAAYADVLGEAGRAAYRRLAEAEWAKVRALGPGEEDPDRYDRRWRITAIMEAIARADDDLEALVAIKSHDLSLPHAFLAIAELYRDAGDPDRALAWAERGWRAFAGPRRDERLRAFIADAYQSRGRCDEAMALVWEAFTEYPRLEAYQQLEEHARRAGHWPDWRDKALSSIRERIADQTAEPPAPWPWGRAAARDHSLLVEVFLHEGDLDAAWREAETGGCATRLWLALAKRREKSHPADAIRVYRDHVAALLRDTGDGVYREAIGFIEKIETLLVRCGQDTAFAAFLTELRATHRRKRNLMKMLDRKGW
ncbi:MAG: tetratricopeptide repeat protein, partial [Burkholderiales bacterium]